MIRELLLATTMLVAPCAAYAQSGCTAPAAAAAVGYNTQTLGSNVTLGQTWQPFNFFGVDPSSTGVAQNSDGTVSIRGGGGDAFNAQLSTGGNAFGGGGYFEATLSFTGAPSTNGGWPSFWANGIEGMSGQGGVRSNIEVDAVEFDTQWAGLSYGSGLHDWYGGSGAEVATVGNQPVMIPPGTDLSQPHTYGFLWVPATATRQGYLQWFFDGKQVGTTNTWDQYNPSLSTTANPYSVLDVSHLSLILGTGPDNPMTVYGVDVWQNAAADNIGANRAPQGLPCPTTISNRIAIQELPTIPRLDQLVPESVLTPFEAPVGDDTSVAPIILSQPSPEGASPYLPPPSGTTTLTASGYTEVSGDDGNHFIAVTNQGNIVSEVCGEQTVRVTGDNNAIALGPYDDTVSISGIGNTIDAGGGTNTIILLPGGGVSTATIVNSVPANYRPPTVLTDTTQIAQVAGNTIVLPSPGTGEDIIKGKLTAIDRVDMTQALAGTTWDHNMATIGNYMTTNRIGASLMVKVGNKVVALFTDGVPGNDITPFLIAH